MKNDIIPLLLYMRIAYYVTLIISQITLALVKTIIHFGIWSKIQRYKFKCKLKKSNLPDNLIEFLSRKYEESLTTFSLTTWTSIMLNFIRNSAFTNKRRHFT